MFSPNRAIELATIYAPSEDGHWLPGAQLGTLRVQIETRTVMGAGAGDVRGSQIIAGNVMMARAHKSSLAMAGNIMAVRGGYYRIASVVQERSGFVPSILMHLREVEA